jgi:hypothetical protein
LTDRLAIALYIKKRNHQVDNSNLTETEKRILKWDDPNDDSDTCDLIHKHFTESAAKFPEWGDVSDEGVRLYGLMFGENIEDFSPLYGLFAGVAAAAYYLAVSEVARQLGVTEFAVQCALETDRVSDSDAFVKECKQTKQHPTKHDPELQQ